MEFRPARLAGLVEIIPPIYTDERGLFFEAYRRDVFGANGIEVEFVQDNQSFSTKGVVRGLHFQRAPQAQGKLVRVITGRALDVCVDIRPHSPTFGQHETFLLDSQRNNLVYVPVGFAHGFAALEDTILLYKCTAHYHRETESGILWNDPALQIDWQLPNPLVSAKDQALPLLANVIL